MIEITIGKTKYSLPAFKEISVKQFRDITNLPKKSTDIELVAKLASIPMKVLKTVNRDEFAYFVQQIPSYLTEYGDLKKAKKYLKEFEFNKITYTVPKDIGKCTVAQWFDFNQFLSDNADNKDEFILYPRIVAIYCQQKGKDTKDYNGPEAIKVAESFDDMPFVTAFKIVGFFLRTDKQFSNSLNLYFQRKMTKTKAKQ